MISLLLALPTLAPAGPTLLPRLHQPSPTPEPGTSLQAQEDEYETKLAEAGEDTAKLWELQTWCKEQGRNSDRRKILKKIIEVDPDHTEARKALGHHFYADQWFSTRTELAAYRRKEEREMAEKGLVRFGDEWVSGKEAPFMRMGWVKDEASGVWASPARVEELAREATLRSEGHQQQQQGVWIHPDDFEKWRQGLWKCGEDWLEVAAADEYHSEINRPWRVVSDNGNGHFVLVTTSPNSAAQWGAWWAEQTYKDLVDLFGVEPARLMPVYMMGSVEMYNMLATGSPENGIPPVEGQNGWSAIHYAFFADNFYTGSPLRFEGGGICYYDHDDESLAPFGQHAVRHAAALSYMDAIDPSWEMVSKVVEAAATGNPGGAAGGDFWGEKSLPIWLRYGAASFVERYFLDSSAENPNWPMEWTMGNLGGLRPLGELYGMALDAAAAEESAKLIKEAGLVVAFISRGGNAAVDAASEKLKTSLEAGEGVEVAVEGLQQALIENEAALRSWAGLEG